MKSQFALTRRRLTTIASALLLAGSSALPMLLPKSAGAAQMTRRQVEMSTSVISASATGDFIFQIPSSTIVQGIEIEFTDNPLGTYGGVPTATPAVGASPTATILSGASTGTLCGTAGTACNGDTFVTWDDAGAFTVTRTDGSGFTGTAGTALNQIHLTRTSSTPETADTTTNVHALRIGGLTNNANENTTFFARIRVYSDNTESGGIFTAQPAHDGTVAGSTAQVLTVNARVQEVLQFCIGAETQTNVTAWTGSGTSCGSITNSVVDLGAVESSGATVTPDADGNNSDGIMMLRTNAVNGASIVYRSILETSSGALKIAGQSCSSTDITTGSKTDRCFNSSTAGNALTGTGVEGFGMRLVNVDTASETPTANLSASTPYSSGTDYSWNDTGATTLIASSTGASERVVDDEAFQLRFGARSALTTPTGQYTVSAEFIAAAVY